jgi:hypothetical protein
VTFETGDITQNTAVSGYMHAVVTLDVIEHIPPEREAAFMGGIMGSLYHESGREMCVIGTPSANADHLASPQSRVGHVNLFTPDRLRVLMARYFHTVITAGMQDTSVHFGHPEMAHYLIVVGIGPRRG